MNFLKNTSSNVKDYLIDHPKANRSIKWTGIFFVEIISALIFAYGFKAFINPPLNAVKIWTNNSDATSVVRLISGGASGVSQVVVQFLSIFFDLSTVGGENFDLENTLLSVLYFVVNIPLFILAFRKITKQFTFFTLLNVLCTSLFMNIIPDEFIARTINVYDDMLFRAILGGLTTGVSSGLAMLVGSCSGGSDIVTIYLAEKKSTSVGKYSLIINTSIVLAHVILAIIGSNKPWNESDISTIVALALYTIVYTFVVSKALDIINQKNRKQEMHIFTSNENIPQVLVRAFPHSATIIESKGAFSGRKNFMVVMVISKSEQKKATQLVKIADPHAFFTVTDINQVYGRFYIKPLDL